MKRFLILFLAVFIFACHSKIKESVTGLIAESAMVVSAHGLVSNDGVDIMRKGVRVMMLTKLNY